MSYTKNYKESSFGDLIPVLEKSLMLDPGKYIEFSIDASRSPRTVAVKCREYFSHVDRSMREKNIPFSRRDFVVSIISPTVVRVTKKPHRVFGVHVLERLPGGDEPL